jgi:hypothetical protein
LARWCRRWLEGCGLLDGSAFESGIANIEATQTLAFSGNGLVAAYPANAIKDHANGTSGDGFFHGPPMVMSRFSQQ